MYPWYRPRSRGANRSATLAAASVITPPAAMPWTARKAISSPMLLAAPESAENTMNMRMAALRRLLRPYMSDAFPHSGVEAAAPRTYTVTTQDRSPRPPSSPAIVGSAVAMIVWSRAPINIATSRPAKASITRRCSTSSVPV